MIDLTPYERKVYSQNGEDGILRWLLLEQIRPVHQHGPFFVEIGCGPCDASGRWPVECNTRHIAESQAWRGVWIDREWEGVCQPSPLIAAEARVVSADNVQNILAYLEVPGHFDLLSLDIDGQEYHVLHELLQLWKPLVIVVEYNASYGLEHRVEQREAGKMWDGTSTFGSSLLSLDGMIGHHGYVLVGCDSSGTNAFFVRRSEWVRCAWRASKHQFKERGAAK